MSAHLDQVILVNEYDQEIGVLDKTEAHRGEGKLHRAISVFLYNSKGELLIQQRSKEKIVGALQWANTCCGNVRPGETYEACAERRLAEELGITCVHLEPAEIFMYQTPCNDEFSEHEMDHIFVGIYEGEVTPNPVEVETYKWIAFSELTEELNRDQKHHTQIFSPWLHIMFQRSLLPILDTAQEMK
jgi:isopentenyl-diphosphate delta-isomerase